MSAGKIFIAGSAGMVGSALVRALRRCGQDELLLPSHAELDLSHQAAVEHWFARHRPEQVYLAAARVGGIHANSTYPADFIYDNLLIQSNVIHAAWKHGVSKLCFLGSSCIYPKHARQPITEDSLLAGPLEPTNQWYAVAKIAGIKLCQAYRRQHDFDAICLMPTNLYGPGDNFHPENAHVLPALIRRFHEARESSLAEVILWGTGTPRREFLHVDDLADACLFLMARYSDEQIVNVGVGQDITILELANTIAELVGYRGRILTDPSKPDGTPRKQLDVSRLRAMGWEAKIALTDGIAQTIEWFANHRGQARG